jgi:hypothetical protein
MIRREFLGLAAAMLAALLAVGCADGPKRRPVSGTVTLGGKPVPVGEIIFEPDSAKGTNAPGSVAPIKDGRYVTQPNLGVVEGAYIVRIALFDGIANVSSTSGNALLPAPYVEHVDFPPETTVRDFDIPLPRKR